MRPAQALSCLFCLLCGCLADDFVYYDFNTTYGLSFNGDATTTSCDSGAEYKYQPRHGLNDYNNSDLVPLQHDGTDVVVMDQIETDDPETSQGLTETKSFLHHRDIYGASPDPRGCALRARLTSSEPRRVGSVFHKTPFAVLRGFETAFTFQITDQSRACNIVRERTFGGTHHESCFVHGADGFAVVLHGDPAGFKALGGGGKEMGYGGLSNALAIEFDTWFNPELNDYVVDHVGIQAHGPDGVVGPDEASMLVRPHNVSLADGQIHQAKVAYFSEIRYDFFDQFTATPNVADYVQDNEETRRVGTLVVWVDDFSTPLMAVPINLSKLLDLSMGQGYLGFTSATGRSWQKHDILSWYACEQPDCPTGILFQDTWTEIVDFHHTREVNP